ncbi:MAG: hypothetical protein GY754_32045 [bacterium]|nr:hypothetical protein [bacterium]
MLKNQSAGNNDLPIVLVHGYAGWGRQELSTRLFTIRHWGAWVDIQKELRLQNHEVITPSMGPFSSIRDRACELYAELMNNAFVDYGEAHAAKFNHARFKPNKWHNHPDMQLKNGWSKDNKLHLVCHSMGAPTARLLAHLLEYGDPEEMNCNQKYLSPLFDTSQDTTAMIKSIVTIAGINDGIVFFKKLNEWFNVQKLFIRMSSIFGRVKKQFPLYDCKLEQFGLKRKKDESLRAYKKRIKKEITKSNLFFTDDFCFPDLNPTGMYRFNSYVRSVDDVYYFSYAAEKTRAVGKKQFHIPRFLTMVPVLWIPAFVTGRYTVKPLHKENNNIKIDKQWWPNDGVISSLAQRAPVNYTSSHPVVVKNYDSENPEPGVWNYMGKINSDHWDTMGFGIDFFGDFFGKKKLMKFYNEIVKMLKEL